MGTRATTARMQPRPSSAMDLLAVRRCRQRQDRLKQSLKDAQRVCASPYVRTLFSRVVEMPFDIVGAEDGRESPRAPLPPCQAASPLPPRPSTSVPRLSTRTPSLLPMAEDDRSPGQEFLFPPAAMLRSSTVDSGTNPTLARLIDSRARPATAATQYRDKLLEMSRVRAVAPNGSVEDRLSSPRGRAPPIRPPTPQRAASVDAHDRPPTGRPLSPFRPPSAASIFSLDGSVKAVDEAPVTPERGMHVTPLITPTELKQFATQTRGLGFYLSKARSRTGGRREASDDVIAATQRICGPGLQDSASPTPPMEKSLAAQRKLEDHFLSQRPPTASTVKARECAAVLRVKLLRRTVVDNAALSPNGAASSEARSLPGAADAARSRRGVVRARFNRL
jgi:hypothetical protein